MMKGLGRVLGLNRTQDASACLLEGGEPVCLQKERITREKHHWGALGDVDLYMGRIPGLRKGVDLVVECYSSDPQAQHRDQYHRNIREHLGNVPIFDVSHHFAHACSAFYPSSFDRAAVMVIDAQGSRVADLFEEVPGLPTDRSRLEVASFYVADQGGIRCVAKQTMPDWKELDAVQPAGLGWFYLLLTQVIFPGEGNEGKVMGLAPYGDPDALGLGDLEVEGPEVRLTQAWRQVLRETDVFRYLPRDANPDQFRKAANLSAAGQRAFERALLRVADWLRAETGIADVCFAGGAALNCSANGRLIRETTIRRLFVPPAPHDGGTALGCALHGALHVLREPRRFRWTHDFLGPVPVGDRELRPELEAGSMSDLRIETPPDLAERCAEYLVGGGVLAMADGRSESGPRALGHRSILADPRHAEMTDWINVCVKGRERFRPLAPVVLEEHASAWFVTDRPLPFMQMAVQVLPDKRADVPAIVHVDGSARLQTVNPETPSVLRDILQAFHRRTGVPMLMNTSLNGPGEPMVETIEEALALFRRTPLHALVCPPLFITKRREPPRAPHD